MSHNVLRTTKVSSEFNFALYIDKLLANSTVFGIKTQRSNGELDIIAKDIQRRMEVNNADYLFNYPFISCNSQYTACWIDAN